VKKIIVIGSTNQDIVIEGGRIPSPGETVFGDTLHFLSGGKGLNQAIAAKNFNEEVLFVGKVGDDIFGYNLIKYFEEIGLNNQIEKLNSISTGTAVINIDKKGENAITLVKGANDKFNKNDLKILDNYLENDILLIQNEINQDINHLAIKRAKELKMTVFFNIAPSYNVPVEILSLCDFVIVNEHELEEVFSVGKIKDYKKELLILSEKFNTNIILTLGELGSIATYENKVLVHGGHKVEVKDTTGAGDCFCGVLISGIAKEMSLPDSLKLANKAASMSVGRLGANNSFPKNGEVY